MKYKVIKEDKQIDKDLEMLNKSHVARLVGVSKQYLNLAMNGKVIIPVDTYREIKKVLRKIL